MRKCLVFLLFFVLLVSMFFCVGIAEASYKLSLDAFYGKSLFSEKYDIDIFLNDHLVTVIKSGNTKKPNIDVEEGPNTIYFYNHDERLSNKSEVTQNKIDLNIKADTIVTCDIYARSNTIDIENLSVVEMIQKEIEDGEIVFRDISWGANYDYIRQLFKDEYMNKPLSNAFGHVDTLNALVPWFPAITINRSNLQCYSRIDHPDIKVAGYKLDYIYFYFAKIPNDENKFTDENRYTSLYAAQYDFRISNSNFDAISKDLLDKMNSLYGKVYDTYEVRDTWTVEKVTKYYIWKGKNNTYACLCAQDDKSSFLPSKAISIVYASTDYEKQLVNSDKILDQMNTSGSDVKDGL